jgi:hypothetical protein
VSSKEPPERTDLQLLDDLIGHYERHQPEAGQRIVVNLGPGAVERMLKARRVSRTSDREFLYRGRVVVAVGTDPPGRNVRSRRHPVKTMFPATNTLH